MNWPHVWGRLGSGVGVAVLTEPDRVLALLARCAPHVPLPPSLSRTIGLLARRDPTRLLGVLLDSRRTGYVPGGKTLWRGLLGASDAELVGLGRVLARDHRLVSFLRAIPPGRRAAVYSGVLGERDLVASEVPVGVLDTLPAAARAEEATRLLGLRTVADDPRIRLQVTARLPWDHARGPLAEATGRATAEERAEVYPLCVKTQRRGLIPGRRTSRRRTDLLDEVFSKPHHGRFLARGVHYLPPFDRFDRWLPRQMAEYARRLASLATEQTVLWERVDAVRRLGRLPGTIGIVRAFLEDESPPVADAALSALAWTDEPADVLGDLLTYADGDRAHIAIYAASRCARFVPPGRLGQALGPVLTGRKITARKEAARLLAMHQEPEAATALSDAWVPDQHRDVRRALVSASQWFLADERAWELLDLNPHTIAERHRGRYAALVRAVAAATDPDTARLGLEAMPKWCRWDDAGRDARVARRPRDDDR